MYDIFDICDYFLLKQTMNHQKLECLCFYTYAWYYALYQKELFTTTGFVVNGNFPYDEKLFQKYKHYGNKKITPSYKVLFPKDISIFLDSVFDIYGQYMGEVLVQIIKKEPPYQKALHRRVTETTSTSICLKQDMKEYYLSIHKE